MNKKYMFGFLFFAMATFATAGIINYYGSVETTIEINQPIEVNGEVEVLVIDTLLCDAGDSCSGSEMIISNNGDDERTVSISNNAIENEVTVSYIGSLELTKKDTTTWEAIDDNIDDKITITYTVVGDSIEVSGVPEGSSLIYYKDIVVELGERLDNPQPAILVTSDIGSLPQGDDANADSSADYCNNVVDNYKNCRGAKFWVVPTSDINDGVLTWTNMANYYYETNLVQYSTDGNIIVYGDSETTVTPEYTLATGLNEDNQIVTTTVNLV